MGTVQRSYPLVNKYMKMFQEHYSSGKHKLKPSKMPLYTPNRVTAISETGGNLEQPKLTLIASGNVRLAIMTLENCWAIFTKAKQVLITQRFHYSTDLREMST